ASVVSIVAGGLGALAWTRFLLIARVGVASLAGIILLIVLFQYQGVPARAAPASAAPTPQVAPGQTGTALVPAISTVEQIITALQAAENRVQNVFVDGRVEEDTPAIPNDRNGGWNTSPMGFVVRAWFDGRVDGPFRMEVAQHINQWTNGAAPYWESRYDAIYDGRSFSLITRAQGPIGQTRTTGPFVPGSPTSDLERTLGGFSLAAGTAFTPNFWNSDSKQSLSAYLRARATQQAARPDIPMSFDVRTESTPAGQIVCLTVTDPVLEESWRFDPARGWAIVGFQSHRAMVIGGEKLPEIQMNIADLLPMPDGVWYPSRAQYIQQGGSDHAGNLRQSRFRYTAAQVIVNSPDVAARIPAPP
ncbi:MAG: hypothetical protein H7144_10390, partial [Burkholderiales bacterium]|nr:hypothetical protein [Phycisphaerae bacterium]